MKSKINGNQVVNFAYTNCYEKLNIWWSVFIDFEIKKWDIIYWKFEIDPNNENWIIERYNYWNFIGISKNPKKWYSKYWIYHIYNWPGCELIRENDFIKHNEANPISSISGLISREELYNIIKRCPKKIILNDTNIKKQLLNHPTYKISNVINRLYQIELLLLSIKKQFEFQSFIITSVEQHVVNQSFHNILECFDILSFSNDKEKVRYRIKKVLLSLDENDKMLIMNIIKLKKFDLSYEDNFENIIKFLLDLRDYYTHWWYYINIPVYERVTREPYNNTINYISHSNNMPLFFWYSEIYFHKNTINIFIEILKQILLTRIHDVWSWNF